MKPPGNALGSGQMRCGDVRAQLNADPGAVEGRGKCQDAAAPRRHRTTDPRPRRLRHRAQVIRGTHQLARLNRLMALKELNGHTLSVDNARWREIYLETNDADYSDWLIEVQLELVNTPDG